MQCIFGTYVKGSCIVYSQQASLVLFTQIVLTLVDMSSLLSFCYFSIFYGFILIETL